MDDILYQDQSANNLRLSLIRGPINSAQHFDVLDTGSMEFGIGYIKADIIGASHVINFKIRGFEFSEIFACVEPKIGGRRLVYGPLKDFSADHISYGFKKEHVKYSFSARISDWDEGEETLNNCEKYAIACGNRTGRIGLVREFPSKDANHAPKTIVTVWHNERIQVETVHSYPNERRIVFTKTSINY